jgi:hypothetical protein
MTPCSSPSNICGSPSPKISTPSICTIVVRRNGKRLVCPERISINIEDGEARLRYEWLLATDDPPPILTDIIFAGVTNLAQKGTKTSVRPLRIELARPPSNAAILRRHFRCDIHFPKTTAKC